MWKTQFSILLDILLMVLTIGALIMFIFTWWNHGSVLQAQNFKQNGGIEKNKVPERIPEGLEGKKNTQRRTEPNFKTSPGTIREISAYNVGDATQCDTSPCISANGENICEALEQGYKRCATNAFPLGTRLKIQNYGECLVVDRMHPRYDNRIDIAFPEKEQEKTREWGIQKLRVQVIK